MTPAPPDPPFESSPAPAALPAPSSGLTPAALAGERSCEDYAAADRTGCTGRRSGQTFAERAQDLAREYGVKTEGVTARELVKAAAGECQASKQRLAWEEVRGPIQAAYERIAQSESARMLDETARPGSGDLLP